MKLWKRICIVICLLLSILSPVSAASKLPKRWVPVSATQKGGIWFDSESITEERISGDNRVHLWILGYFPPPREAVAKTRYVIDLRAQMMGMTDWNLYNMKGNLLQSKHFNAPYQYSAVIPDSVSEKLYKIAKAYHESHNKYRDI